MVLAGGTFVPAEVVMRLRPKVQPGFRQDPCPQQEVPVAHQDANQGYWPPRQLAVLELLVQGKPNKEIGHLLAMEESTVNVHVRHIMRKLGALNRIQAAVCARRIGLSAEGTHSIPVGPGGFELISPHTEGQIRGLLPTCNLGLASRPSPWAWQITKTFLAETTTSTALDPVVDGGARHLVPLRYALGGLASVDVE